MRSYRLLAPALMMMAAWTTAPAFAQDNSDYLVQIGDSVDVSVYGKPDLSGSFRVRGDGNIVLHILGPIPVHAPAKVLAATNLLSWILLNFAMCMCWARSRTRARMNISPA